MGRSAAGTNGAGGIAETDGIAGTTGPPAVAGSAGAATGLAGAAQATAPSPPMELFGSPARVIRYIGSIAPPGRERARKRYALEGIRHVITAWEPLPTWWYELREKFESGEV